MKRYVKIKYICKKSRKTIQFLTILPYNFLRRILGGINLYKKIRVIPFKKKMSRVDIKWSDDDIIALYISHNFSLSNYCITPVYELFVFRCIILF